MNKQHKCIKFTSESEQNNTLSFLDINITVLGKKPPPGSKRNPIPNLTLTLPLTPHGGFFQGGFFPDTNITRQNNQLKTYVYRKPTFSGVFRHYDSYIDQSYKKTLIFTLLSHCYSISSDYTLFHLEAEKLRKFFKKNSYPSGIIEL